MNKLDSSTFSELEYKGKKHFATINLLQVILIVSRWFIFIHLHYCMVLVLLFLFPLLFQIILQILSKLYGWRRFLPKFCWTSILRLGFQRLLFFMEGEISFFRFNIRLSWLISWMIVSWHLTQWGAEYIWVFVICVTECVIWSLVNRILTNLHMISYNSASNYLENEFPCLLLSWTWL